LRRQGARINDATPDGRSDKLTRVDAGAAAQHALLTFQVLSVRGTTCQSGKRVFRAVSRWVNPVHDHDLRAPQYPHTLGYRCRAHLVGDSAWNVRCVRGRRVLLGFTAK
jgi:hypothetical protein